jgi:hypothetical protein
MIAIIHIAPAGVFYYWQKLLTGGLGQSSQNGSFIAVINFQERSALASESDRVASKQKQSTDDSRLHHCVHSNPHSILAH